MKKVFYILGILSTMFVASCQKDPVKMTATAEMAGQWYVTVDAAKGGQVVYEDVLGLGNIKMFTSNTAADVATEMLLSDDRDDPFWDFKVRIKADPAAMTFSADNVDNLNYDCKVTVTGGKIVKGGAKTPSGMPADYIEFHIVFSDDDNAGSAYDDLFIHGYRYTGFAADE
jgi:hypothetical protein